MHQKEKTNVVRQKAPPRRELDEMDRKILSALARNADRSYASLGELVNLSAPAVHERVKRLKESGAIRGIAAMISPEASEKHMLAFIHVTTTGWGKSRELLTLERFPEIEEIHSVAGDTCMVLKVRTRNSIALEGLLANLYALDNVVNTKSYVVLSTALERPIQGDVSSELEDINVLERPFAKSR